jgi:hypothetical protein
MPTSKNGRATISGARRALRVEGLEGPVWQSLCRTHRRSRKAGDAWPPLRAGLWWFYQEIDGIGPKVQRGTSQPTWLVLVPGTRGSVQLENRMPEGSIVQGVASYVSSQRLWPQFLRCSVAFIASPSFCLVMPAPKGDVITTMVTMFV